MDQPDSFALRVAEAARELSTETSAMDTIELAANLALDVVEGTEEAAISLVRRNKVAETTAATAERALAADRLQFELAGGPIVSDIWDEEVVSCPNFTNETRWGDFGPKVAQLGINSGLFFRMFSERGRLGVMSLYSSREHGFDRADIEAGMSFAAHTAVAICVAQRDENKDLALDSRTLIGQATGIVMERYDLDAVRAFAVLKRVSSHQNLKIHEVAVELIRTRALPG